MEKAGGKEGKLDLLVLFFFSRMAYFGLYIFFFVLK